MAALDITQLEAGSAVLQKKSAVLVCVCVCVCVCVRARARAPVNTQEYNSVHCFV
jgi:hypothetical protein